MLYKNISKIIRKVVVQFKFSSPLREMTEGMSHPSFHPWPLSVQHLCIAHDRYVNSLIC